ncbi:Thioesterase family protein [Rhynchospora pubera]|uniref:Thioesterase family protein n=1 Tax=Rhynchospora pubera TaxID=906938 RepID=A0AAV8H2F7_9POAL|nr:Thioesterase family protein [Rhynchospora pubera]
MAVLSALSACHLTLPYVCLLFPLGLSSCSSQFFIEIRFLQFSHELQIISPQDIEGNWQPGPIALLIDMVSAAAIMSCEDTIKVSVDLNISFFSSAKIAEEMEIEALVLQNKGKLTGAVVEVRKKADRNLVAVGRQWMTSSSARPFESKL